MKLKFIALLFLAVFCSGCFALKLGIDDLRDNPAPEEIPVVVETPELAPVPE